MNEVKFDLAKVIRPHDLSQDELAKEIERLEGTMAELDRLDADVRRVQLERDGVADRADSRYCGTLIVVLDRFKSIHYDRERDARCGL